MMSSLYDDDDDIMGQGDDVIVMDDITVHPGSPGCKHTLVYIDFPGDVIIV